MWRWLRENSLWLVALGLMLASSGLDGVYMAQWMPAGWGVLGFVLNTMADIASPILTHWFGRLQQGNKTQRRFSFVLLPAEFVAVAYSWLFSYRRLLVVLQPIEPTAYTWMAPLAAGFIPSLLAFIGFAQSLLVGRFEPVTKRETPRTEPVIVEVDPLPFLCDICGAGFDSQRALAGHGNAHRSNGNGEKVREGR